MKCAIVVFPGSNCDTDTLQSINSINGMSASLVFYKETTLENIDCVIIPGGFSYGDYLRAGSIARFAPIMKEIINFANNGGLVIGICNGFQILLECNLLPGAMLRNKNTRFICRHTFIKTINNNTPLTNLLKNDQILNIPIAHHDGNYFCNEEIYKELQDNEQIIFKYSDAIGKVSAKTNINGSAHSIAGISNKNKNVFGLMPHPERATDNILGSLDGINIFKSIKNNFS